MGSTHAERALLLLAARKPLVFNSSKPGTLESVVSTPALTAYCEWRWGCELFVTLYRHDEPFHAKRLARHRRAASPALTLCSEGKDLWIERLGAEFLAQLREQPSLVVAAFEYWAKKYASPRLPFPRPAYYASVWRLPVPARDVALNLVEDWAGSPAELVRAAHHAVSLPA